VHQCFQLLEPLALGGGRSKIFHRHVNASCHCSYHINYRMRDDLLNRGELLILCRENVNNRLVPDWCETIRCFVPADAQYKTKPLLCAPRYMQVTARHLEKAYIDGLFYGELAR